MNATGGLLIFCVSLLIFEIRKVPVTDYLPSLIFAPLLTWLFRYRLEVESTIFPRVCTPL